MSGKPRPAAEKYEALGRLPAAAAVLRKVETASLWYEGWAKTVEKPPLLPSLRRDRMGGIICRETTLQAPPYRISNRA